MINILHKSKEKKEKNSPQIQTNEEILLSFPSNLREKQKTCVPTFLYTSNEKKSGGKRGERGEKETGRRIYSQNKPLPRNGGGWQG